jgi:hypothetical protein
MLAAGAALGGVTAVEAAPEGDGFGARQPDVFQEERIRDASVMLQATLPDEVAMHATKAERKA